MEFKQHLGFGLGAVAALGALHDERHILVAAAYLAEELDAGFGVLLAVDGEAGVADDAQYIVAIAFVHGHRLFIGAREHHLGASAHTHGGGMAVERLGREALALQQYIIIKVGEYRTVEPYAVFDHQDHLHARLVDVVVQIHLVLYQFDDREYEVGIAQPAEYVVEDRQVFVLHALGDAMRERSEHYAVHVGKLVLDVAGHGEGVVVGVAGHTYHQIYVGGLQHLLGLLGGAHLSEGGRIAQSQQHIFIVDFLLDASVVFEHEGVVGVGDDEHIVDASHHQIDKAHVFEIELLPLGRYLRFHKTHIYIMQRYIKKLF